MMFPRQRRQNCLKAPALQYLHSAPRHLHKGSLFSSRTDFIFHLDTLLAVDVNFDLSGIEVAGSVGFKYCTHEFSFRALARGPGTPHRASLCPHSRRASAHDHCHRPRPDLLCPLREHPCADVDRIVIDAKTIAMRRLHPLKLLAHDILRGIDELLHYTSMNEFWHRLTSFCAKRRQTLQLPVECVSRGWRPRSGGHQRNG